MTWADFSEVNFGKIVFFWGVFSSGFYDALNIAHLGRLIYRSTRIRIYLYKTIFVYLFICLFVLGLNIWNGWNIWNEWNIWFNPTIKIWGIVSSYFISYFIGYFILLILSIYHHFVTKNLWISIFTQYNIKSSSKLDIWYFIAESIYGFIFSFIFKLQNNIIGLIVWLIVRLFVGLFNGLFNGNVHGNVHGNIHGNIGSLCYWGFIILSSAFVISWSSYEYKLIYMNKPLVKRIRNFEKRWLYFLGFGMPYAILYYSLIHGFSFYSNSFNSFNSNSFNSNSFSSNIWMGCLWLFINTLCTIRIIETKPQKNPFQKPSFQKLPFQSNLFLITHYCTNRIIDLLRTFFGKPK